MPDTSVKYFAKTGQARHSGDTDYRFFNAGMGSVVAEAIRLHLTLPKGSRLTKQRTQNQHGPLLPRYLSHPELTRWIAVG